MLMSLDQEQASFQTFLNHLWQKQSQDGSFLKNRQKAWNRFMELGLPGAKTEQYRTIKLRHLFSQQYEWAQPAPLEKEQVDSWIYPECRGSALVFVNGHFSPELSCTDALPSSVVVAPLQEATLTYGTFLNNYWTRAIKEEEDPFAALNAALQVNGAFIYIPPKLRLEVPIQILQVVNQSADRPIMTLPRLNIYVGSQAELNVAIVQKTLSSGSTLVNQLIEFAIEEDAYVNSTQVICDEHPASWHLAAMRAQLKRRSNFKNVCVTEGCASVRTDYRVVLNGENAEASLNGLWTLSQKREAHTNVVIDHQAPNCRSHQLFKGVLDGFSRSSFEGKIMVRQAAQKTDAFQLNNNLLLSDRAQADSKPNLEIFADDVKASHGATVGQLDPEQLFYMRARGCSAKEAMNLLLFGFCEEVIERISLPSLREDLLAKASNCLQEE